MISNQVIQNSIDDVYAVARVELCVLDAQGILVASTWEDEKLPEVLIKTFISSQAECQTAQEYQFFKVFHKENLEYVLVAKGNGEDVRTIVKLAVCQIKALLSAYQKSFDVDYFLQNLLLDNLSEADMRNGNRKLHMERAAKRVVFLIETKKQKDTAAVKWMRTLYADSSKDLITTMNDHKIVLIKELCSNETPEEIDSIAFTLVDMLNAEAMTQVKVSYGSVVQYLEDVSKSYNEAKMALDIGHIFYSNRKVLSYSNLGIGRLIYQMPEALCEEFLHEVFTEDIENAIDRDTLDIVYKFFGNNLNLSETSRQLYMHRNTLVYRLGKLQKATKLDIRNFEDALVLRIALMVYDFLEYRKERGIAPG